MKDLCQKWKVKLIFRGDYRLSGIGIVECLDIMQSDGLTWLTPTPPHHILRRSTPLAAGT